MVIEYIRYNIPPEQSGDLEAAYARAANSLEASPNCLAWELTRSIDEPQRYILRIEWDSVEGHLQGFRGSPQFQTFLQEIRPFIANIEEMKHYQLTSVIGRKNKETYGK